MNVQKKKKPVKKKVVREKKVRDYVTTDQHFTLFKSECKQWIKYFGLLDFGWSYYHEKINDFIMARLSWNLEARSLCVTLNKEWWYNNHDSMPVTKYEVCKSAFHEVCEGMLCHLTHCLREYYSGAFVNSMIHTSITRLENSVFTTYWKRHKNAIINRGIGGVRV